MTVPPSRCRIASRIALRFRWLIFAALVADGDRSVEVLNGCGCGNISIRFAVVSCSISLFTILRVGEIGETDDDLGALEFWDVYGELAMISSKDGGNNPEIIIN